MTRSNITVRLPAACIAPGLSTRVREAVEARETLNAVARRALQWERASEPLERTTISLPMEAALAIMVAAETAGASVQAVVRQLLAEQGGAK
jgi:hypothetical protein